MERVREYFYLALRNLKSRRLRSWLTIFGIVIGVFLIISLISLSEGLKESVMRQLKMLRGDIIFVMPGGGKITDMMTAFLGGMELNEEDIKVIERTRGVERVVPFPFVAEVVRWEGKREISFLAGINWDKSISILRDDMGYQTAEGRFPISGKKETLVGNLVPKEIFPTLKIGDEITIKGRRFEVVGILKSVGNKQDDSMVMIDLDDFRIITGKREGAPMVIVKPSQDFSVNRVAENIKINLEERGKRKMGEDAPVFSVITGETWASLAENIMGLVQAVILAFASIALVVGGIGIMNTMYTAVRERTREIGIMKAIGAKNSEILTIFLIESGIIGVIGGMGGTVLGIIFAKAVEIYGQIHPLFYITASVSPGLIIFSLVFSFLVGCLSGFFPARRAANLKPVEALRRFE